MSALHFVSEESRDPFHNLAREEWLLNGEADCFYLWQNEPSVILGRHQNAVSEVRLAALGQEGARLVRRLTGGGAVYHDAGNLNLSYVFSCPGEGAFERGCALAREEMQAFLRTLGIVTVLSGRNDLCVSTADGLRKVSGSAMLQRGERGLFHATLLWETDLGAMERLLSPPQEKLAARGVPSVRARVENLRALLPERTAADVRRAWEERLRGVCRAMRTETAADLAEQKRLEQRFRSRAWVRGRDPACGWTVTRRFPVGTVQLALTVEGGTITRCVPTGDYWNGDAMKALARGLEGAQYEREAVMERLRAWNGARCLGTDALEPVVQWIMREETGNGDSTETGCV